MQTIFADFFLYGCYVKALKNDEKVLKTSNL